MEAKINVRMDNAAFEDDPNGELARILRDLAIKVDHGSDGCVLMDINGNRVGEFTIN